MGETFRSSMTWLHTWSGVVLGGVLFAIFWTGTLSVFDREIDRWMMPSTRLARPPTLASLETLRPFYGAAEEAHAPTWLLILPTGRDPVFRMTWYDRDRGATVVRLADPSSGRALAGPGTLAGSGFIYPFHYMLHLQPYRLGYWLVGAASMAMLALCLTGVVIHRKIFAEFFALRADRRVRRVILDTHNVSGVLGLPFHVVITLSGLVIFISLYFPGGLQMAYRGDGRAYAAEAFGVFDRPAAGQPGALASLERMVEEARLSWRGQYPQYVLVRHVGDAAAFVQMVRRDEASVGGTFGLAIFDAAIGDRLQQRDGAAPIMTAQRFIAGLHLIQFRHWTLRWVYFGLGLLGCVMIATGYLFWLEARRKRHAQLGLAGVRLVEGLTVGSVTGLIAATLSFFVVNRVLPLDAGLAGCERDALEIWTFYVAWLSSFAHAWLRPRCAWAEQCAAIAILAVAAVLLNWITTGDHLALSLARVHLWPIAGMDLLLLFGAAISALTTRQLLRVPEPRLARPPSSVLEQER